MIPADCTGAPALVLGSGPVACVAAVSLARRGRVVTLAMEPPVSERPSRVDAVPIQILATLIEIGIHPETLGVSECHATMLRAWDSNIPTATKTPPKAHLDRRTLEEALFGLASRIPGVRIEPDAKPTDFELVLDATGRRALTAAKVHRATPEWVARVRSFEGRFTPAQAAFRIAALPFGYIYRLATTTRLSLGLVAPLDEHAGFTEDWRDALTRWDVGWLAADIPANAQATAGRGGACSLQWAESSGPLLIGDAAFAPDILAAQGLSHGLTEGLAVANQSPCRDIRTASNHLTALRRSIALCRWRRSGVWQRYDTLLASPTFGPASRRHDQSSSPCR